MLYSLVTRRIEDVASDSIATGVTRFDDYLRQVFPRMVSITPRSVPRFGLDDVVIADNHLSLLVPPEVPCIVVHHGCAQTHLDRVPSWRTADTQRICDEQRRMFSLPNRAYVAPSRWVGREFARHYGLAEDYAEVIVNWVPLIEPATRLPSRVVIGDWRDENKGAGLWREIAGALPECEFRSCDFRTDAERIAFYQDADVYLCLSASEGGSYAMCDAEAAGLTIVSMDAGNAREFQCIIPKPGLENIVRTISGCLRLYQRNRFSFFAAYPFDVWAAKWRAVVDRARQGAPALKG